MEKKITITTKNMQIIAAVSLVIIALICAVPYWLLYGTESLIEVRYFFKWYIFIPAIAIGVLSHEIIHGISWAYASGNGLKSIKYGFQWKTITPYAHSKVPIKVKAYRIGTAMPLIVMGVIPYFIALIIQNPFMFGFAVFFIFTAVGDIIVLWLIRNLHAEQVVQDHPSEGGVILLDE